MSDKPVTNEGPDICPGHLINQDFPYLGMVKCSDCDYFATNFLGDPPPRSHKPVYDGRQMKVTGVWRCRKCGMPFIGEYAVDRDRAIEAHTKEECKYEKARGLYLHKLSNPHSLDRPLPAERYEE